MTRQPSWETIARALGERMQYHAFCPESVHGRGADNIPLGPDEARHKTIEAGLAEGCPFCQDRAAYRLYEQRAGKVIEPEYESVPLSEVQRSDHFGGVS